MNRGKKLLKMALNSSLEKGLEKESSSRNSDIEDQEHDYSLETEKDVSILEYSFFNTDESIKKAYEWVTNSSFEIDKAQFLGEEDEDFLKNTSDRTFTDLSNNSDNDMLNLENAVDNMGMSTDSNLIKSKNIRDTVSSLEDVAISSATNSATLKNYGNILRMTDNLIENYEENEREDCVLKKSLSDIEELVKLKETEQIISQPLFESEREDICISKETFHPNIEELVEFQEDEQIIYQLLLESEREDICISKETFHPNIEKLVEFQEDEQIITQPLLESEREDNCVSEESFHPDIEELAEFEENEQIITQPLSERIKISRESSKKIIRCKYCFEDIISKNFMRHLLRHHRDEKEVEQVISFPKNSRQRREALGLLRNTTNFDLFINGIIRPNRLNKSKEIDYYPCAYCRGLFAKTYLRRHSENCVLQKEGEGKKKNQLSESQTLTACAKDPTNTISKLNIMEQVFNKMKPDEISFVAKKDLLIAHFGDSYFKKHRRERMAYACSNRMRELSRLLICYRQSNNMIDISLKELLHPKYFDNVIFAVRNIAGYDIEKKTFRSPSLAMHIGTSLKIVCDECTHLVLKETEGFRYKPLEKQQVLINIKHFKKLIESRWNTELASLANKDLQEKKWKKPLLVPLASDIQLFREGVIKMAHDCMDLFKKNIDNENTFKLFVNCILALLIVFNRRRIGDVQYLKISDYLEDRKTTFKDFENVLSETEKLLTKSYKRIVNTGKGSRAVVILVPDIIQNMIKVLLEHRPRYIIDKGNEYLFAAPGSSIKWGKGDVAIRSLSKKINLQNPQSISSNKLRKQIATVMQLINLSKDDAKQFSTFMGHTQKTHDEFYELPVDIYQTAKVSKLLLMMEKGTVPKEHIGKSLTEIEVDCDFAEESELNDDGVVLLNTHENGIEIENMNANNLIANMNNNNALENMNNDIVEGSSAPDQAIMEKMKGPRKIIKRGAPDKANMEKMKGPSKIIKRGWTDSEISKLRKTFGSYIKKKTYPSTAEINQFIEKYQLDRTSTVVKSKLQHLMKF